MYTVIFSENGRSDLIELRIGSSCIILSWISEYLEGCENPRVRGRSLAGEVSHWRYIIGKFRVLAEIEKDEIVILAIIREIK